MSAERFLQLGPSSFGPKRLCRLRGLMRRSCARRENLFKIGAHGAAIAALRMQRESRAAAECACRAPRNARAERCRARTERFS